MAGNSQPWWRRGWVIAGSGAAVIIVVVVAVLLATMSGTHRQTAAPPSASSTTAPSTRTQPAVNPLTGRAPSHNSVVAVKIDDTAAGRPQRGIDQADIVYVEEAEGGLTRLLAVYNTVLPVVEPVRSTRAGDEQIAEQYGRIVYVASGGSAGELAPLDKSTLRSAINDRGAAGFSRDPGRSAPYNLKADLAAIARRLHGPKATDIGLTWSSRPPNGTPGTAVRTTVGATPVAFNWSPPLHRYVRLVGDTIQHATNGKPVATPNVIVQFCRITNYAKDIDQAGNPARYTHTIGTGKVVVFRDGRRINGTWSRSSAHDGTHLRDSRHNPIPLAPGGAWFVLVPTGTPVS